MALSDRIQPGTSGVANPPFAMLVFSASVLTVVALWFQIAVEFVPALNDIISIYRISALENPDRWINGGDSYHAALQTVACRSQAVPWELPITLDELPPERRPVIPKPPGKKPVDQKASPAPGKKPVEQKPPIPPGKKTTS
jgi:hypothetical protein